MKRIKAITRCLPVFICLLPALSFAQATDSTATEETNHFIAGVTYNSAMNYYGRVDSLKSKGLYPFLGVSLKNGLYLTTTFIFIGNSQQSQQYAATQVEGGYNFKDKKGNWAGAVSGTLYFYQASSDLVQSAVKQSVSASITNLNKIVNVTLGADAKFSNSTDIGVQAGLDHIIRFPNFLGNGVLVLDPSAYMYSGTQNFTQSYYEHKNLLFVPVTNEQVTTSSQRFGVLAYELSLPVIYGYKKLNLIFTPAYVLPQNVITVAGQPNLSEKADNLFYLTASVKVTL